MKIITNRDRTTISLNNDVKKKLDRFWSKVDPERNIISHTDLIDCMIDELDEQYNLNINNYNEKQKETNE